MMSSAPRKSRAPIKGSAGGGALSSRRAMTERRHQMAGSIRKARRSHAIALKKPIILVHEEDDRHGKSRRLLEGLAWCDESERSSSD